MKLLSSLKALFALTIASVALIGVSIWRLQMASNSAFESMGNLQQTERLASRIQSLRTVSSVAVAQDEQKAESTKTWIAFAKEAGINEANLTRIERLALQKIAKTEYSRDDVFFEIKNATAKQVVEFIVRCETANLGYRSTDVQFSRVNAESRVGTEQWNVSLVLTRMVFTGNAAK